MPFEDVPIEQVKAYWDRRPCNIMHSAAPLGTKEYFDEVEARKYKVEPHIPQFADFIRWKGKRVLEIGCGIGTDTINFARYGALVTAVDLSGKSLALSRKRAEVFGFADRIEFIHGSAEHLEGLGLSEYYDLVYAFGVFHHTPDPRQALMQAWSHIKDGGTLKLMVYHKWSWKVLWIILSYGGWRFWKLNEIVAKHSEAQTGCPVTYVYSKKEIRDLVEKCGFKVQEVRVEHIFPYRIPEYIRHRYRKVWYFRWIPRRGFRWLETHFGWHLLVTAVAKRRIS